MVRRVAVFSQDVIQYRIRPDVVVYAQSENVLDWRWGQNYRRRLIRVKGRDREPL